MVLHVLLCVVAITAQAVALDNGLALTPPMGWISWQRFRCNTDCTTDPTYCISENLYKSMADIMVADGYKDAGYVYVNIDDCWSEKQRDPITNRLVADHVRFPSGIRALADYVHGKGLKLGIYADMGNFTCAKYPGSQYTLELDAQTFADWQVDSLKMDGCAGDAKQFHIQFPQLSNYLNKTGRPILYNCEWPLSEVSHGITPNYTQVAKYCNIWRNFDDVVDTWASVTSIIEFYGANNGNFAAVSRPGAFNDPDMIVVGNPGLSFSEQQVQMAMWAIFAAPLFLSSDLRNIDAQSRSLILNKGAIQINQDPLGIMGKRVMKTSNVEVWARKISPPGSYAIAVLNLNDGGSPRRMQFTLAALDREAHGVYLVTEVFTGQTVGTYSYNQTATVWVDESSVVFWKYVIQK